MEDEPSLGLTFPDGTEFELTRDNTSIFRFIGRLALYDHIYFLRDEAKGLGSYLFNQNTAYEQIADYMMENDYPAHINLRNVAECDQQAFDAMVHNNATLDLESGVPDDWV